jgi:hypothetical protein
LSCCKCPFVFAEKVPRERSLEKKKKKKEPKKKNKRELPERDYPQRENDLSYQIISINTVGAATRKGERTDALNQI